MKKTKELELRLQDVKRQFNLKFYFSIVLDEHGDFKAMIPVDVQRRQHFYLMDKDGQHEYVSIDYVHCYHYVGNAIAINNANAIKQLLKALDEKDEDVGASSYIHVFNSNQSFSRTPHDKRFLNASCKSARFTESGFYF